MKIRNLVKTALLLFHLIAFTSMGLFAADLVDLRNAQYDLRAYSGWDKDAVGTGLGLAANESLTLIREIPGTDGMVHSRYQQRHNGFPIWGEQVPEMMALGIHKSCVPLTRHLIRCYCTASQPMCCRCSSWASYC